MCRLPPSRYAEPQTTQLIGEVLFWLAKLPGLTVDTLEVLCAQATASPVNGCFVFERAYVTSVPCSPPRYEECTGRYVDFDSLSTKMRGELRNAMDKWEAVAGVQFVEVPYSDGLTSGPNGQIDLAIAMANGEPGGTAALTVVADGLRDLVAETNRECGTRQANPVRALR